MPNFVVNTNAVNGIHHVHDENALCQHLPEPEHRRSLGWFSSSQGAIHEAKKTFNSADGCKYCAQG